MKKRINDGWSFTKLPYGSTLEEAERAHFVPVEIPHDWLIWQAEDLYETSDAWYRRKIVYEENDELPVTMIRFDGVYMDCDVIVNGKTVKSHPYGYTPFDIDLTGLLHTGENEMLVHVRHRSPNSRWYSGSGIYRDVFLSRLPWDHLVPDGLSLKEETGEGYTLLHIRSEIVCTGTQDFVCTLTDAEGMTAAQSECVCSGKTAETTLRVEKARLWSPEDPYLYNLSIQFGKQTEVCKVGLRTVSLDPDRGLFLNGKNIKLKGVCLHHDLGALGAAFHPKAARRQLQLMQRMGANAVRTSHNPPAEAFLDLCDELGLLVVDEAFDMWEKSKTAYDYARFFPEHYAGDIAAFVRRDRRHPSVIMWSIGNEIYDVHAGPRGAELTRLLAEEVRKNDDLYHAYTTFGCNYMPWAGGQRCAEYLDAVGYNYGESLYETHHRDHPGWVIYGSETGSVLSSRGVYHFPIERSIMAEADQQCSALGNSNTSWGAENLRKMIVEDLLNPFSMGQFIWSGIDYIGEPTPYHTRSCYFGQADTACFPKDPFYLFKSLWTDKKMIHIGVSWDWNHQQLIDIPVMTNCSEAELILNGRSLGRKKTDRRSPEACMPVWKIPFEPGELTARGYDETGCVICEDHQFTPGETKHLALSCEDEYLRGDGNDLVFITVTALDEDMHPVHNARDRIMAAVTGGGRLMGMDNGDPTDPDGYKTDCRRLFNGKLLIIIGSDGGKEPVHIRIDGNCGISAEMTVPVQDVQPVSGAVCGMTVRPQRMTDYISVRKIDLYAVDSPALTQEQPECRFRYTVLPESASERQPVWQVTNLSGIETPNVELRTSGNEVTVRARGDGKYYLRGLAGDQGRTEIISQIEFEASGFGNPALDPYAYIPAGLYDLHEGEIGTGNEKGISFARGTCSMAGFSIVDFGRTGSDVITADIFALNGDPYEMELWACEPGKEPEFVANLHYQKPSIWNVYQAETWKLPRRLKGIMTVLFRMNDKVHMKGFRFEKQQAAFLRYEAADADLIYGDQFERSGKAVTNIGNNVTLAWNGMDFSGTHELKLAIEGSTPLPVNTIQIRIRNEAGEETVTTAEFDGDGEKRQVFDVHAPEGICTVSLVFLPGSSFSLQAICFSRRDGWT